MAKRLMMFLKRLAQNFNFRDTDKSEAGDKGHERV